jgi:hypothetical protein
MPTIRPPAPSREDEEASLETEDAPGRVWLITGRRGRTSVTIVAALPEFTDLMHQAGQMAMDLMAKHPHPPASLADVTASQAAMDASATVAAAAEYMRTLWTSTSPVQHGGTVAAAAGSAAGTLAVSRSGSSSSSSSTAQLPTAWDVEAIRRYWATRPLAATRRSSALVTKLLAWVSALLLDIQVSWRGEEAPLTRERQCGGGTEAT